MATAAFKSTTKRSSVGGGASDGSTSTFTSPTTSSVRRRARSVSRFSHHLPPELDADFVEPTTQAVRTRGKFVNTVRGAAFPEISLDDLAIELFSSGGGGGVGFSSGRGRTSSEEVSGSSRRGRSVSRQSSEVGGQRKSVVSGRVKTNGDCDRRRRSLSLVRYSGCDSESDDGPANSRSHNNARSSGSVSKLRAMAYKPTALDPPRGLRRCSSQRDMLRSHDGYSSHSSALTDDERKDAPYGSDHLEKPCSFYSRNKVTLKKKPSDTYKGGNMQPKSLDVLQASGAMRSYSSELEQSEMRKQELLKEIILEEKRGKELRRMVKVLPEPNSTSFKRPSRARRRSNDRRQITKQMDDDAQKIIEDFISSVEDNTDISSFEGERSDTSSSFGVPTRFRDNPRRFGETESQRTAPVVAVEMDGVVLPWLQWDASNDSSLPCKVKSQVPATPKTVLLDALEEMNGVHKLEQSSQSNSSHGSWSPVVMDDFSVDSEGSSKKMLRINIQGKNQNLSSVPKSRPRVIDMDDYLKEKSNEEFIYERWNQRERISSGGMLLCESSIGGMFQL